MILTTDYILNHDDRVKLSKTFDVQLDKILLKEAAWYQVNNIEVFLETVCDK
jgi:hypothetical protein